MAGEGLGKVENTDAVYDALFKDENPDVIGIGDVIVDKMIDLEKVPKETIDNWEGSNWYPGPGESLKVEEIPELDRYVENELPGGRSTNQTLAAYRAEAEVGFVGRSARPISEDIEDLVYDVEVMSEDNAEAYVFVDGSAENRIACTKTSDLTDGNYVDKISEKRVFEGVEYLLVSNGENDEMLHSLFSTLENYETEVIFDPAPTENAAEFFEYDCLSYLTPNETEYKQLEKELERAEATVIQTSAEGAIIDQEYFVEAPEIESVDTTGAGDTFNGYLAAGLSDGLSLEEAVENATYAASLSVAERGAQPSIPEAPEVEEYLDRG